jgi:hypothetical protein
MESLAKIIEDPKHIPVLVKGIERAIQRSYDSDLVRDGAGRVITTADEIKRRTNLCIDMARDLRFESKWSVWRIADALPILLRRRLDGLDFDPTTVSARATWFPDSIAARAGH